MDEGTTSGIVDVVRRILRLIVEQDYEALERLSDGRRLTADEIRGGFTEFPFDVVVPPEEKLASLIDVINVRDTNVQSVWVNLWTVEEGRSDLQLRLTLSEKPEGYDVEIDEILVP